jgi:alcohol dehydrogenase class IV
VAGALLYPAALMAIGVENARREWEDARRRLEEEARDPTQRERLDAQVEAVLDELRRRVGSTFTLSELAEAYAGADRWSREAVEERAPTPGWPRLLSVVEGAAFHLYQRGAVDYSP